MKEKILEILKGQIRLSEKMGLDNPKNYGIINTRHILYSCYGISIDFDILKMFLEESE